MINRYKFLVTLFLLNGVNYFGQITNQQALPSSVYSLLDINNVKAQVSNGYTMWNNPLVYTTGYFVKDSTNGIYNSMVYSAGLNFLAKDVQGNFYASNSFIYQNNFYPGPIDFNAYSIYQNQQHYNRIWRIYKWQVAQFISNFGQPGYVIPQDILEYPAHHSTTNELYFPYRDVNNDGIYNATQGDYPEFNLDGLLPCNAPMLHGDLTLLWIMNDKGMINNTSSTSSLGINVFCEAFAFIGNESINNATFYHYRFQNQSNITYDSLFLNYFIDTDIGCAQDDYVGSDVKRGLAFGYNGDSYDESCNGQSIGGSPPAVGFDFVKGPIAPLNDGLDNNKNGVIDEVNEDITMGNFYSFSLVGGPNQNDPNNPLQEYLIASGKYADGTPRFYDNTNIITKYSFPDSSDFLTWFSTNGIDPGYSWSMPEMSLTPRDNRMMASIGPLNFAPHQIESFTLAVPYARAHGGTNIESVHKLKLVDDTLQDFVNNCYQQGCVPFSNQLFISESVVGTFNFAHPQQGTSYLWDFGDGTTSTTPFPSHSYQNGGNYQVCLTITSACDQILTCDSIFVSYDVENLHAVDIKRIEGEGNGGRELEITYGSEMSMFQNGTNAIVQPVYKGKKAPILVEIIDVSSVISGNYHIAFDGVLATDHWKMYPIGGTDTVYSNLPIGSNNRQIIPQWGVAVTVEYFVTNELVTAPSFPQPNTINEFISSEVEIKSPWHQWLGGVSDKDIGNYENWIASGNFNISCANPVVPYDICLYNDYSSHDPNEFYESIANGTFTPFKMVRTGYNFIIPTNLAGNVTSKSFSRIPSVDIVYTADTILWTRCPVVEMCDNPLLSQNSVSKLQLRFGQSVGKNGFPDGTGLGMGWFPGYAIDVETGGRLNMAFGESSCLPNENGADMKFNPTSNMYAIDSTSLFGGKHAVFVFNCDRKSYNPAQMSNYMPYYDEGQFAYSKLQGTTSQPNDVWKSTAWVGMPMLNANQTLLSAETRIKVRLKRPFKPYSYELPDTLNNRNPLYQFALYTNVSIQEQNVLLHRIYPNPSQGIYNFEIDQKNMETINVLVCDLNGRIIKEFATNQNRFEINMSEQADGFYFYYLYNKEASVLGKGKLVLSK
jgi:hypothetical protein